MALQKQYKVLSFAGGLDLKTDPHQVEQPRVLTAENVIYKTNGLVRKCNGYTSLSNSIIGGGSISTGCNVGVNGSELIMDDNNKLYSWQPTQNKWSVRGNTGQIGLNTLQITAPSTSTNINGIGSAQTGNFIGVVWNQASIDADPWLGTGFYGVRDATTNQWIIPPAKLPIPAVAGALASASPIIAAFGAYLYVFFVFTYFDGTFLHQDIYLTLINTTTLAVTGPYSQVSGFIGNPPPYPAISLDAVPFHTHLYLAVTIAAGGGSVVATLERYTNAGDTAASANIPLNAAFALSPIALAANDTYLVVASPAKLNLMDTSETFGSVVTTTAKDTGSLVSVLFESNGAAVTLIYTGVKTSSGDQNLIVDFYAVTGTSSAVQTSTSSPVLPSQHKAASLLSKVFSANGGFYIWAGATGTQSTTLQPTGVLVDLINLNLRARILYTAQGGIGQGINLSTIATAADGSLFYYTPQNIAIMANGRGVNVTTTAVIAYNFNFGGQKQLVKVRNGIQVCDSFPSFYDGASSFEEGFTWYPEITAPTTSNSTGGLSNSTHYEWVAVFRRFDAFGNEHFSQPSPIVDATTGATDNTASFHNSPSYPGADLLYYRVNITNAETVFKEVGPLALAATLNTDYVSDSARGRAVYAPVDGSGELPNDPPFPFLRLTATKTRLFAISAEDPTRVYFTKPFNIGRGPEWVASQFILIDPATGPAVTLVATDEQIVVLKSESGYLISGSGPNSSGANGSFTVFELAVDTGCRDPRSVLVTDEGVYFTSRRGLTLLDRSFASTKFIGAPVEPLNGVITGVDIIPQTSQIRFLSNAQNAIVRDYVLDRWSTFTSVQGVDSTVWQDNYVHLTAAGVVKVDNNSFTRDGAPITMKVQSPWIPMSGPMGWGRLYRILTLGDVKSAFTLQMQLYYDYNNTTFDTVTFTPAGGAPNLQYRSKVPRQVMTAVSILLFDTSITGESYDISNLTLELGVKSGAAKLPQAQSV